MRGLFIVFDGIDGCGKSTQLARAAKRLTEDGYHVASFREPGGTDIAEKIRLVILSAKSSSMVKECELLLYAAARAQLVREKIEPALKKGTIVLCDRFDAATFAYQGFGRKMPFPELEAVNAVAVAGLKPDLVFIFSIAVDRAFRRLSAAHKTRDRLESSGRAFFTRVAAGYRAIAEKYPGRFVLLDAELPINELSEMVFGKISDMIKTARKNRASA